MHRPPYPKITILAWSLAFLLAGATYGQPKPAEELVVTKCWSYPLGELGGVGMTSDGSRAFLGLDGGRIEVLSPDGKRIWASELGGEIASNILPVESAVLVVTASGGADVGKAGDGVLRALSKETGITTWTLKLPGAERHFLHGSNGSVIVVSKNGVVQSIEAKSGLVRWTREIANGFVASPVFNGGRVLVAASGKQVFGVSMATGEIESMRRLPSIVTSLGETGGGQLVGGDDLGNITSYTNGTDKVSWKFKTGGAISRISTVGDGMVVASHDNFVYFMASRSGDVVWKKRLAGRVSYSGNISGNFTLFTSFEEHGAVLVELSSGRVVGQVVLGGEEYLVSDPTASANTFFILTNQTAHAFSLNGCKKSERSESRL